MSYLCFTIRFLQPYYHGRCDGAEPEWPPSPLRLFQALVAAASQRWREAQFHDHASPALRWLEQQPTPTIVAANGRRAESKYRLYVPDNTGDRAAGSWTRGDMTKIIKRTEKDIRPIHLPDFSEIHFLFPLANGTCPHLKTLRAAARSITHLGWGVDMATGNATIKGDIEEDPLKGNVWLPTSNETGNGLRAPIGGTLDDLIAKHNAFLHRICHDERGNESFNPVVPLSAFRVVVYRLAADLAPRPCSVFELRNPDGSFCRYPHRRLIHLAGMVRHLAIETSKHDPPPGVDEDWVETYIAGHVKTGGGPHRQLSYLPLPSVGHLHTDPGVRRVMIAAVVGDDARLAHLARRLAGQTLNPKNGDEFHVGDRPVLVPVRRDKVARFYLQPASVWHSFTPVILPGHDDHKPAKTRALIERALIQSGIDQPCEFEWSAYARFPKSFSAHKYGKDKRPQGYIRPSHLLTQTAVHLTLRFKDDVKVPGPIVIGAGRHCGLGLMVGEING